MKGTSGTTAAYTSVNPNPGCSVKTWPPHVLHHLRLLCGVLLKAPIFSSPRVILTFSGCHNVLTLMGSRRPMAARIAMTIAHAHRRAGHGEVDRSTETTSDVAFWTRHSGFLFGFKTLNDGVMLTVRNRNLATRACTDTDDLRVYCWEVLAAQPAAAFVGSNIRAILRAPQRGTFQPHLQAR